MGTPPRLEDERGYVAVLAAFLAIILFGLAAFTVDVGRWYLVAQQEQRAADAAALGGVPNLPGDPATAFSQARALTSANGFTDGLQNVEVATSLDGQPTRLRVTVTQTIENIFGRILGVPETTVTRTAVADYAGPVPMGSPCNAYGNDPEPDNTRSDTCQSVSQFWANVGTERAPKANGDAYQNNKCANGVDGCASSSGPNVDYDPNGYFYAVTVRKPTPNLVIEAFDPALIHVGDLCDALELKFADGRPDHASPGSGVENPYAPDAATRYAMGKSSPYCTGDISFDKGNGNGNIRTEFAVRDPGPNPWDPLSFPVRSGCTNSYNSYNKLLKNVLDEHLPAEPGGRGSTIGNPEYEDEIARVFRQWVPLCTISDAQPGTYMVQVKTNVSGTDASGHNRFALRAYSMSDSSAKDSISISGFTKMAMYANLPSATTSFYLARVPSGAAGQMLNVRLFDVGDATNSGTITVLAPPDSGVTFKNCLATGPIRGQISNCSLTAKSSTHNGKWQTISVPIPADYACQDRENTKCWVRLKYAYGSGNQPNDTTSWSANIEGDPVRLVE